jgi:hypothetical protein
VPHDGRERLVQLGEVLRALEQRPGAGHSSP